MGNLQEFDIDWNAVEEVSFEPLKAGSYGAKVVKSEIKLTKKNDKMMALTFDVLGTNRKIFANYMMTNKNPKAVAAGLGKVKSLCSQLEIDFDQLQDTSELHGKPVGIKVKIESSEQYGDQNSITSFFEYSDDLLDTSSSSEEVVVDEVEAEEPDVVEDDEAMEDDTPSDKTPEEIRALKKDDLLAFIKVKELDLDLKGLKN